MGALTLANHIALVVANWFLVVVSLIVFSLTREVGRFSADRRSIGVVSRSIGSGGSCVGVSDVASASESSSWGRQRKCFD